MVIKLLNPITGTVGANGIYGNPIGTNGGAGGANSVYNYANILGGGGGAGGSGGVGYNGGAGGSGGVGVNLASGTTLTNDAGAHISGGGGGGNSAFTGEHFVLGAAGSGTDVTLATGADATFAGLGSDALNFMSDYHRALAEDRTLQMHGPRSSMLPTASAAASDHTSVGFASHSFNEQGVAHAAVGVCKA